MDWIWNVLWPVLGVLAGFAAGWGTKRSLNRREESRALNELITYLHQKRTLAPIDPQPSAAGPMEARHRSAVLDLRENLMETLARLTPGSSATAVLMRMSAAGNRYLRDAAEDPERYQFALMELRQNLEEDLRILTDGRRDVRYLSPGEAPERRPGGRGRTPPSSSSGGTTRPKRTPGARQ